MSMDLITLMITAALLHRPLRQGRAFLAAALGGLYAAVGLLLPLPPPFGFLGDLAMGGVICLAAFACKGLSPLRLLKDSAVFALSSAVLGGVMTAIYSLLNRLHLPFDALEGDGLSVWTFALLTAVASFATLRGGRLMGLSQKTKTVTLEVILFGKKLTLSAMVDTGNLLKDPISGKSVIVAELSALSPALPPALQKAFESGNLSHCLSDPAIACCLRPIPTRTATGEGMLFALRPDELTVISGKLRQKGDHLIAPAPLRQAAQGFDAVFPLD